MSFPAGTHRSRWTICTPSHPGCMHNCWPRPAGWKIPTGQVQDIEFTVQKGTLYLLQSRTAKRAPAAAVRIAVDMQREGAIDIGEALSRVTPAQVRSLLSPRLTAEAARTVPVATGNGVSHGVGAGVVVTSADEAEQRAKQGEDVILATATTCPDDVHGMIAARAVVTEFGGSTSHAAVVGRSLGLPCVVGCGAGAVTALDGETVTVDGAAGGIYPGVLEIDHPDEREDEWLRQMLHWAAERSPLRVLRPDEAPVRDILDLDALEAAADPDRLAGLLQGVEAARGRAISSDEGVAAALAANLRFIVAEPTLPPLLAAVQMTAGQTATVN